MARAAVPAGKTLVQSKTFWFNVLSVLVAVAALFGFDSFEASPAVAQVITVVTALVNIGLRVVTREPVNSLR